MEPIHAINPERIAWCCADHGIAPDRLASELGMAQSTLSQLMQGEDCFTFNQLSKLADYFGRGVLFFLEPGSVNDDRAHSLAFRTLASQKPELSAKIKSLVERVERQRAIYLGLREELNNPDLPQFAAPNLARMNTDDAARRVRTWLNLGEINTFDSYRAAIEAQGILVFRSNGYHGKWQIAKESPILGFALYDLTCPTIVIKKQENQSQQSFTLMHELAHVLLHKISSIDDEQDIQSQQDSEREANAFAGKILVPDTFLATIIDANRPADCRQYDDWLERQRKAWGVSGEVILRRLLDSGRLSKEDYAAYRKWRASLTLPQSVGGSRAYRHREAAHIFGDTFVRTVLDALNGHHITLTKASRYLDGLKLSDLHQLEQYYASF